MTKNAAYFNLRCSIIQAGTHGSRCVPRYPGRRHPHANAFRRLEQCDDETRTEHLGSSQMQVARGFYGRQPMIRAHLFIFNESCGEAHAISRENWVYSNRHSPEFLFDTQIDPYHYSWITRVFPADRSVLVFYA
jgi:hypothetical protein